MPVKRAGRAAAAATAATRSPWAPPPMYIGPPDPISNLRPVVFGVADQTKKQAPSHPYSLAEFSVAAPPARHGTLAQYAHRLGARLEAAQLQSRLQSMWLDQFNQRFWTDNNARFQRALAEYEAVSGSIVGQAPLEQVAPFYRAWLAENAVRLRAYNRTLWLATARVVAAQTHDAVLRLYTRLVAWLAGMR